MHRGSASWLPQTKQQAKATAMKDANCLPNPAQTQGTLIEYRQTKSDSAVSPKCYWDLRFLGSGQQLARKHPRALQLKLPQQAAVAVSGYPLMTFGSCRTWEEKSSP